MNDHDTDELLEENATSSAAFAFAEALALTTIVLIFVDRQRTYIDQLLLTHITLSSLTLSPSRNQLYPQPK
jgi:hypothetical protein